MKRFKLGTRFGNITAILGFVALIGITVLEVTGSGTKDLILAIYGLGLLLVIAFT